jgi:hypothetical protein
VNRFLGRQAILGERRSKDDNNFSFNVFPLKESRRSPRSVASAETEHRPPNLVLEQLQQLLVRRLRCFHFPRLISSRYRIKVCFLDPFILIQSSNKTSFETSLVHSLLESRSPSSAHFIDAVFQIN